MAGVPVAVIAEALGHADERITRKHYAHLAPSYVRDAVRNGLGDLGIVQPRGLRLVHRVGTFPYRDGHSQVGPLGSKTHEAAVDLFTEGFATGVDFHVEVCRTPRKYDVSRAVVNGADQMSDPIRTAAMDHIQSLLRQGVAELYRQRVAPGQWVWIKGQRAAIAGVTFRKPTRK